MSGPHSVVAGLTRGVRLLCFLTPCQERPAGIGFSQALAVLGESESKQLAAHELVIKRGLSTFVEVGRALMAIRDGKLYRASHRRFADYCNDRWQMTRMHAHRLIEAAEATEDVTHVLQKPANARQACELAKAPKEQRAEVWEHVVESAPRDEDDQPIITAAHVAEVVEKATEAIS